ncbi:regulator of G-protein signaling loco-like isoform X2 [Penaeus monodon]|uniref:regulator of G-protein signaling loco-like isoform X2 n=1 Tax=Penaeus monodon TaxID=6687 RepID=UPI0018A7977F|nr:regulator of G-protein signaling loco-like isoform X2 [Penaeus monodon]
MVKMPQRQRHNTGGGAGGAELPLLDPGVIEAHNAVTTARCCVPLACGCLRGYEPISLENPTGCVRVQCNNEHCTIGTLMHGECFTAWEAHVLAFLRSCGRARSWSEKQRLQNLWTKRGYDLAYRACSCLCNRGHLRKDLDWTPPTDSDDEAKTKKKKKNRQNQKPTLVTVGSGTLNNNNNNNTFKKRAVVNGDVVLRSASSVGKEDVGRKTVGRRSIDSIRRLSGGQRRPESLNEGTISRNSDPSSATSALASSMASLKALFGVGGDAAEPLGFRRIPSRRTPKKPAAASTRSDLTPKAKRQVRQRNNDTTPKSSSTFYTKSTRTIPAASLKADEKDSEVDGGVEKKWTRSSSLRRTFHHSSHNSGHQQDPSAHSDTEIGKISAPHSLLDGDCGSVGGSVSSERGIDVGRVGAWATSFEKLLEDPAGLHTFAEFLKKEYSHENIYFWTACERYKRLSNSDELRAMAKEIFERHLCIGASEPVNVDSQARQDAQDGLHSPNEFLFAQAQKQIFNLMKFDSYSRFLKSNLYKDCVSRDIRGQTLPYPGDETLDPDLRIVQEDSHVKLKKSKSDADERRRKSLLPWHRKDRSKSKDRGEAEYRRRKKMGQRNPSESSSVRSDMSGSRTSLNSSDIALGRRAVSKESLTSGELGSLSGSEGCNRCRVILPDLSNSVVAVRPGESIQVLLTRLLERRGISYSTFDVYQHKSDKLMEKTEDSSVLGGLEVRLEQRILFRLDLPNRKTVCVKAKPNKLANEVLKPILHKYGYKLDLMTIHKVGEEKGVNLKCHVNELDGDRLVVQTKEEVKEWGVEPARQKKRGSLDEITNRVFEDLLNGKSEQNFDELGVLDFDARSSRTDRSSDRSSGILGGFSRRNSLAPDKESNKKPRKPNSRSSVHENLGVRGMMPPPEHAIVTKRRGNNPANAKQENDELYEGLKRAQRSRLDDQRGTEINFELPDFLKCDQPQDKENQHAHLADQLLAHLECSFSEGGVIPSHQEAEDYFSMAHPEVWGGIPTSSGPHSANATLLAPDIDLDDFDDTLQGDESLCQVPMPETTSSSLHIDAPDFSPPPPIPMENSTVSAVSRMPPPSLLLSPPPLPPKPKLGGTRGPPPRPPSRQLHLLNPPTFSSTSDDDALHSNDAPIHITRQSHDKFNISFV